jgi:hypothetical protein
MREANEKRPWRVWACVAVGAALLAGCASERGPHPELPRLGLLSQFTSHNLCGLGVSPEIKVFDVPAGTASYRVQMTLVSAVMSKTWQNETPARGTVIPEGALPSYDAPCPPERQIFRYRLEVMAMAANGQPVAYGWNFFGTPALSTTVNLEQGRTARGLPPYPQLPDDPAANPWPRHPDKPDFYSVN